MRLIAILICFALLLSYISHPAYTEDSVIKQELLELEALIEERPPFFFRDGMHGKLLFKQELKHAILLVEDNKLKEAENVIHHLLAKIDDSVIISNPILRENIRQKLIEILIKITQVQ